MPNLAISVYRVANRNLPGSLGDLVFQQTIPRFSGTYRFVWNGLNSQGQPAPNGDYDIVVEASDGFGGSDKETVGAQVNRQGKTALAPDFRVVARLAGESLVVTLWPLLSSGVRIWLKPVPRTCPRHSPLPAHRIL